MRNDILKFENIRSLRVDRDLTLVEVATHLNIAQNTLSQYETGERNIPNDLLVQLALFYGTSVDYLLGLTDNPVPYPRKRKK